MWIRLHAPEEAKPKAPGLRCWGALRVPRAGAGAAVAQHRRDGRDRADGFFWFGFDPLARLILFGPCFEFRLAIWQGSVDGFVRWFGQLL